jgi:hypothetical protein
MDFFVMLSSSSGVAGNRGQSNYAAGMKLSFSPSATTDRFQETHSRMLLHTTAGLGTFRRLRLMSDLSLELATWPKTPSSLKAWLHRAMSLFMRQIYSLSFKSR